MLTTKTSYAPALIADPDLQMSWLYDFVADQWADWLPAESVQSLRTHGYFTALLRPGLRVIQVNSNVCYVKNVCVQTHNTHAQTARR